MVSIFILLNYSLSKNFKYIKLILVIHYSSNVYFIYTHTRTIMNINILALMYISPMQKGPPPLPSQHRQDKQLLNRFHK
jgi:hypothetical protein